MALKFEDYYKTLGLARSATADEIKRAYRKLAQKFHPDRNKESDAADRFSKISEAYEVLKDPEKRQRYDELGENWKAGQDFRPPPGYEHAHFRSGGPGQGGFDFQGEDFSDFFRQVFGQARGPGNGRTAGGFGGGRPGGGFEDLFNQQAGPQSPPPQEAEITVSLHEAYHGSTRQLSLDGAGGRQTVDVKIPKGVKPGSKIRLKDLPGGGLILKIQVAPDPRFTVDGVNLTTELSISPAQAALGCKADVETLDGPVTMTIPAGTSSGSRLRIREKGLGSSSKQGDLYVKVKIAVPKTLSDEQQKLYEQLLEAEQPEPATADA
jgi:curved DNA-binding protein